jgi:hypothetical protein
VPPPNITGALHLGHALNHTIMDALGRWKRMCGYNTLILPGTDHAGIATQSVVEREIAKQADPPRPGREVRERVWEWKPSYGDRIVSQLSAWAAPTTGTPALHHGRRTWTPSDGVRRLYETGRSIWAPHRELVPVHHAPPSPTSRWSREESGFYHIRYPFADGGAR